MIDRPRSRPYDQRGGSRSRAPPSAAVTSSEHLLVLALCLSALAWLGLAFLTLLARLLHDARVAVVEKVVERGLGDVLAGTDVDLERLLGRLPRRTIERVAADTATAAETAALFVQRALEQREQLLLAAHPGGRRPRWRRIVALRILARGGSPSALELLELALESPDEDVVAAAVATLGELGGARAAELLVGALRADRFSRSRIAAQLDKDGEALAPVLVPLLAEPDAGLRYWAATLLSRYVEVPEVAAALAAAARDEGPSVRAAAVESLAAGGGPLALDAAVALLEDPVWFVRAHAARALAAFERDDLVERVAPLLADESWWVRAAAKETLSARHVGAPGVLVGYLGHPDEFARNGAAEVLQNIGAVDALIRHVMLADAGAEREALRRVLAAGGQRALVAAAARNRLDPAELERLAAGLGDLAA